MSKIKRREWLDMTRLDFRHTFRSPLVEILIALFLYVSVSSVANIQNISTNTGFGGTDNFLLYINSMTNLAFSKAVEALWMTLVFIVPPLVAFTTAKAFEDGSLRTILSYPIKRWHLLVMRIIVPTVIVGACGTFSIILVVSLMIPAPWNIGALSIFLGIFWLMLLMLCSSIIFIAVLARRMIVAAVGGVAVWFGLVYSAPMDGIPEILKWIGNPFSYITRYILGEEFYPSFPIMMGSVPTTEAVLGFIGFVLVVIILLNSLSILLFKKMEV